MRIKWDETGEKRYETGTKHGVLFVTNAKGDGYNNGVAWNGLTGVSESPSGGEANPQYADDIKYLELMSKEELGLGIEAFTYPPEFAECDGTAEISEGVFIGQQRRKSFAFSIVTVEGNDTEGEDYNEKLHIYYGCKAAPSEKGYQTISDSPEPITFSWDVTTTPVSVNVGGVDYKPTASVTISKNAVGDEAYTAITDRLYGTNDAEPTLLLPSDIYSIIASVSGTFTITVTQPENGAIAPASATVEGLGSQAFTITPDTGYQIDSVVVDGEDVGALGTYTFENVTADHTITAVMVEE